MRTMIRPAPLDIPFPHYHIKNTQVVWALTLTALLYNMRCSVGTNLHKPAAIVSIGSVCRPIRARTTFSQRILYEEWSSRYRRLFT